MIYLVFNEGHAATRAELRAEAIRLARLLVRLMPDEAETHGLLALLLLTDGRSAARVRGGELVSLADQDRTLWDAAAIAEGATVLERAVRLRRAARLHDPGGDRRPALALTRVRGDRLGADRGPLRRAVAPRPVAGRGGQPGGGDRVRLRPRAGLAALPDDPRLERYQPLHAARAELLRRAGDAAGADAALQAAIELSASEAERSALRRLGSAAAHSAPAGENPDATSSARSKPSANDA